ncbi:MAG: error-prone DNA polymerase [Actinomycetota bacterium]
MGWRNPPVPWSELERRLSGRAPSGKPDSWAPGDGSDSPAWSRKRHAYEPPAIESQASPAVPYAELHCHSNFSFSHGASDPEELVEEAVRLGLRALALTDHNGFYGIVRFAEAARAHGLATVFGAELTITELLCEPTQLVVLARGPEGYARLARAISTAQLAGSKGDPRITLDELAEIVRGATVGLTGTGRGAVTRALVDEGPTAARRELDRLIQAFGRDRVFVEIWDHGHPLDSARNDQLVRLAAEAEVEVVAANDVQYHTPQRRQLATALSAVADRASLDIVDAHLPAAGAAHLRSGEEQARWFRRYPGVVERAAELAEECAFDLALVAPELPPYPCPDGYGEMTWLRELVEQRAPERYGPRHDECVPGAWAQMDHELNTIEELGFPGYFLIVHDIVEFCRQSDIYCQGRGSAANSAVCFVLGITKADAVTLGLLFERFLSPERDGPPDIDIDIESGRREEVIQYVYERYGRHHTAQVANIITYRARSSVRDMARALGYAPGQQDAFAKNLDRWGGLADHRPAGTQSAGTQSVGTQSAESSERSGAAIARGSAESPERSGAAIARGSAESPERSGAAIARGSAESSERSGAAIARETEIPQDVIELAGTLEHSPRHLGIHSGGMVICDRPIIEVCPVEWARMENRSVLQWDKEDCAATGLVKFDLLGLGMLSALHIAVDLIAEHHGLELDLAALPQDSAVYDMLCRADSIGVFQVESRAQMATLPRLRPRTFYDLVVEVALIRPGPIQGGSVHPYIRRRNGREPVTYLHPLLENALAKTLGIPLFQEQLMQMAIDVAGFTAAEADELRQAMGSKRSQMRMERLRERFYAGMAERDITGETADLIWEKLAAFANFGFPESHSVSFAYLVYSSSWIKHYYPAAFCASLLNAQPMGFYSPHTLVQDARRHGVTVRQPCLNRSQAGASLEGSTEQPDMRMGISSVRHIGDDLADDIVAERERAGPYSSIEDLRRRVGVDRRILEALATAGAFDQVERSGSEHAGSGHGDSGHGDRRQALWAAGAVAATGQGQLEGIVTGTDAPQLPGMSDAELAHADLWATGVAADGHPTRFVRDDLRSRGVVTAADLATHPGTKVWVAGVVTHRQRPATAGGTTFLNLEDETGLINVVVSKGCWIRHRNLVGTAPALYVHGRLERSEGVTNVVAERFAELPLRAKMTSRDFR